MIAAEGGMALNRIMLIRHAEKLGVGNNDDGVQLEGIVNKESLTVRGWLRAGALARIFCPQSAAGQDNLTPKVIFAMGIGPGSTSKRPTQTLTSLVDLLEETAQVSFVTFQKRPSEIDNRRHIAKRRRSDLMAAREDSFPCGSPPRGPCRSTRLATRSFRSRLGIRPDRHGMVTFSTAATPAFR
jgi:hypothetical protein